MVLFMDFIYLKDEDMYFTTELKHLEDDLTKSISVFELDKETKKYKAVIKELDVLNVDELTEEKTAIAAVYSEKIQNPKIKLPEVPDKSTCVWHQYVIRCEERERLIAYLNDRKIGTIIHYPIPPHLAEAYQYLGHGKGFLPITEHLAQTVLSIPMYNGMTAEEQNHVIGAINEFQ